MPRSCRCLPRWPSGWPFSPTPTAWPVSPVATLGNTFGVTFNFLIGRGLLKWPRFQRLHHSPKLKSAKSISDRFTLRDLPLLATGHRRPPHDIPRNDKNAFSSICPHRLHPAIPTLLSHLRSTQNVTAGMSEGLELPPRFLVIRETRSKDGASVSHQVSRPHWLILSRN